MKRDIWFACVIVLVVPAIVRSQGELVPLVDVGVPVSRMVTDHEILAGRLESPAHIDVRPRVTGYLEKTFVTEGSLVRKGEVLFEIDRRPLMAQADNARAQVAVSEASYRVAKVNLERMMALVRNNAVSREEVDKAQAEETVAAAKLNVAKTALEAAQLQLDFVRVLSPIDGHVGRRLLAAGNLVKADETLLTTIVSRDPMVFRVEMPEAAVLRLLQDPAKFRQLPLALALANDDGFPRKATIDFVNNQLDPKKKTLLVGGPVEKAEGLLPGMSVRARLTLGEPHQALLVPAAAVGYRTSDGRKEAFVFTEKDNVLAAKRVQLGGFHGDLVAVKEGIRPDDRVVLQWWPGASSGQRVQAKLKSIE